MLIECHECRANISDAAKACPQCGAKRKTPPRAMPYLLGGAAVFTVLLVFANAPVSDEAKTRARRVIEACWSDQKRPSLDPGTSRYVAGMCENFEADFVRKYGHRP